MVSGVHSSSFSLVRFWWVFAFCILVSIVYAQAMKSRNSTVAELEFRLLEMEKEKQLALLDKEELLLTVASQTDPSWIELVLLRELGVVPEGFLKVHFKR